MPTVIVLDVSLTMSRPVGNGGTDQTRRDLAVAGISAFLDHLTQSCKLEFVSLVIFSSLYEIVVPFTRDYDSIKEKAARLDDIYDKTYIDVGLEGAKTCIVEEWGICTFCQIILITDGSLGLGRNHLQGNIQSYRRRTNSNFPYSFPSKLHLVLIADQSEPCLQTSIPLFDKLVELNNGLGSVTLPEGRLSLATVLKCFSKLGEKYFAPFYGTVACGNLKSDVMVFPPPDEYSKVRDFDVVKRTVDRDLRICGFVHLTNISSPAGVSRHLVLPVAPLKENCSLQPKQEGSSSTDEEHSVVDEGRTPSFCVLLHGALKVEQMMALVEVADGWYGMLYSWADSKKKSNLMLTLFEPGCDSIPWLGDMSKLTSISLQHPNNAEKPVELPVMPEEKRSYTQQNVIWIKPAGLHSDVQKILRHAKKLPEKTSSFYKELNKLRRAVLTLGFYGLFDAVASILDRECTHLPGTAHPDAALQLTHASSMLRQKQLTDLNANINPLRTKFYSSVEDG